MNKQRAEAVEYEPMDIDIARQVFDAVTKLRSKVGWYSEADHILMAIRERVMTASNSYASSVARWWLETSE